MDERKCELAMAIDLRLADLWAEIFEVEPSKLDQELLGWFLRAAYGQGYTDALRETTTRAAVPRSRLPRPRPRGLEFRTCGTPRGRG